MKRRATLRKWVRPEADKVSPETYEYVMRRDGMCLAARLDLGHLCRDTYGYPHRSDDRKKLTLDHVHDSAMAGKRAPSDRRHLVSLCGWANNQGWASAHRAEERAYLLEKEGAHGQS